MSTPKNSFAIAIVRGGWTKQNPGRGDSFQKDYLAVRVHTFGYEHLVTVVNKTGVESTRRAFGRDHFDQALDFARQTYRDLRASADTDANKNDANPWQRYTEPK